MVVVGAGGCVGFAALQIMAFGFAGGGRAAVFVAGRPAAAEFRGCCTANALLFPSGRDLTERYLSQSKQMAKSALRKANQEEKGGARRQAAS